MTRFIDPTTDFGFKKIFGDEDNKEIHMGFITDVLELKAPLLDIEFKDKEQLPDDKEDRRGIYDIYCKDVAGNHFIVEMQKNRIAFVKDRMVYYTTFPIAAQASKGKIRSYPTASSQIMRVREPATATYGKVSKVQPPESQWDFHLDSVYCIAILGYALNGSTVAVNRSRLRHDESPYGSFYDKLRKAKLKKAKSCCNYSALKNLVRYRQKSLQRLAL